METDANFCPERLFGAIRDADLKVVPELLSEAKEAGQDLNAVKERGGQTLLMLASQQGCLPMVQLFVKEGLNVDARNEAGKTALHIAASRGYCEVVSCLLHAGARPSIVDFRKRNALMSAAGRGDAAMVRLLLEFLKKEKPLGLELPFMKRRDRSGLTAFGHAVVEGHANICRIFVWEHGADFRDCCFTSGDGHDMDPLKLAQGEGQWECAKMIEVRTERGFDACFRLRT